MTQDLSRRQFLAATSAVALTGGLTAQETKPKGDTISFFVIGDTHFLADKADPKKLDVRSAGVTARLVDTLNKLSGTAVPKDAGGGVVGTPKGLIHAGDCIDTGDKADVKMQETEWSAFADGYGLTGKDGRLKMPVYEVHGNHDSPRGEGLAIKKIKERNKNRPAVDHVSESGLHYAWTWGGVRFINLGIVVGELPDVKRKRRYQTYGSLDFLKADLEKHVGTSGKPVVITHHVDMLRYAHTLPVDDKRAEGMEWDPADVNAYFQTIRSYHIAAVFYGHTHVRNIYFWDGTNKAAKSGVPVFNVDNSSHFNSKPQAFYYVELTGGECLVREYQTSDGWETGKWTPQVWKTQAVKVGA